MAALLLPASARAQTEWQDHAALWFAADFALAPVGRYTRALPEAGTHDRHSFGGSLAASAFYVGHGPVGIGAHVAPTLIAVDVSAVDARVAAVDVGFDPVARLAWKRVDLTLRLPMGLSTGRLNWVRTAEGLSRATAGNDLGLGVHVAPLVGSVIWLGDFIGLRVESGIWMRRMKFDEGQKRPYPGDVSVETVRGEVLHHSWAWTLSVGLVRRFDPRSLPDENGPPLPTPDYYQPYPLTMLRM